MEMAYEAGNPKKKSPRFGPGGEDVPTGGEEGKPTEPPKDFIQDTRSALRIKADLISTKLDARKNAGLDCSEDRYENWGVAKPGNSVG